MTITSANIETKIEMNDASPFLLCIQNPKEYYKIVQEFVAAFHGGISEFTFWEGDKNVNAESIGEILTDIFYFELTDKKIIALLHKRLQQNFNESDLIFQFQQVKAESEKFLLELCATAEFALDYNEISLEGLLKLCNVKPERNSQTLLEKIICYLNLFAGLKGICNFVLVGLKHVLDDGDLQLLYRHCKLHKLSLLLIEYGKIRPILPEERAIIITEDLCEIVENLS